MKQIVKEEIERLLKDAKGLAKEAEEKELLHNFGIMGASSGTIN